MEALTRLSLRHPAATLVAAAVLSALFGAGLLHLHTDVGYRTFLGEDHASVRTLDGFLARFGGGLPVGIVWRCAEPAPCRSALDPSSLEMAHAVASTLREFPGVQRVESVATTPLLVSLPDGFDAVTLVEQGRVSERREELARRALADPLWVGNLVSADGRTAAIVAELASSESQLNIAFFEELQRTLAPWEARGFEFALVGQPVDFVVAAGELESATMRLVPVVGALMTGLLWLLFRSLPAVIATMGAAAVAVAWTLGAHAWLGWPQNAITQTLPPLVLVVGACTGIHVLSRYAAELASQPAPDRAAREAALVRMAQDIGPACLFCDLTTAGGFLSFETSGMLAFVRYGRIAAIGVMLSLLLSFSVLPVLLARLHSERLPARGATARWDRFAEGLLGFVEARRYAILAGSVVLAAFATAGMMRLRTEAKFEDLYGRESRVVRWVHFVERNLRAPETLEIELELPDGSSALAPESVAALARLEEFLPGVEGLGRAQTLLGPLRRLNRVIHDDDPAFERPGDTQRANATLFFLLTADDPERMRPWLSEDGRHLRVSVAAHKVPDEQLRALLRQVHAYLERSLPPGWHATTTGAASLVAEMVNEIKGTQISSFVTATLVVCALMALLLRSPAWAVLAMIPNALPIAVTLGAMGFLGIQLDVGTAMVAAVVIGFAVDDTVHLLAQYRRRRTQGLDPVAAIRGAVPHVARAVVTMCVALALGFLSLVVSPWDSVASFGVVAAVAIVTALLGDLFLLPALILAVSRPARMSAPELEARRRRHA